MNQCRLEFKNLKYDNTSNTVPDEELKEIWTPDLAWDLFRPNLKQFSYITDGAFAHKIEDISFFRLLKNKHFKT